MLRGDFEVWFSGKDLGFILVPGGCLRHPRQQGGFA